MHTEILFNRKLVSFVNQEMQKAANKKRVYMGSNNHSLGDTDLGKTRRLFCGRESQGLIGAKAARLLEWSGKNYD